MARRRGLYSPLAVYVISSTCEICSSHTAPGPDGQPSPVHGHNFKIVAQVEASELGADGRVLPQGRLREELWAVLQPIDHRHLNDLPQLAGLIPTPTVIARWTCEQLVERLQPWPGVRVRRVEVWPTPTSCQAWEPPAAG